jgi:hypothetical protein
MHRVLAVCAASLVAAGSIAAAPAPVGPDPFAARADSTDAGTDVDGFDPGDLDASTLAELDVLLFDPVELDSGADLDRLAELPWVTHGDLEALRAALPLQSLAEMVTRAGWPAVLAAETAPFVRPAAPIAERRVVSLAVHRSRSDFRWRQGSSEALLRLVPDERTAHGGVQLARGPVRLVVGEFVATHALGLVAGRLRRGADPNRAAWPGGSRLGLATGAGLARGAGIAFGGDRIVAFTGSQDTLLQSAFAARGTWGGTGFAAAVSRRGTRWTRGVSVERRLAQSHAGFEAAARGAQRAIAIAADARAGRWDADARFERTPRDWDRTTTGGIVQTAEARTRLRLALAVLEAGVAARSERLQEGERVASRARRFGVLWRQGAHGFTATLLERRRDEQVLRTGFETSAHTESHTLALTAWRAPAAHALTLEARFRVDALPARVDRAWQARYEHRRGRVRWSLAVATFAARQSIVLPLPAAASGSSLRGDGMRFAAGVRAVAAHCELHATVSSQWIDGPGWQSRADASLALRVASHAAPWR